MRRKNYKSTLEDLTKWFATVVSMAVIAMLAFVPLSLNANVADVEITLSETAPLLQERKITGRVSDGNEVGVIGVSIRVKGTGIVVVTDMTGHYTIDVPNDNSVLEFTAIGYQSREVQVKGKSEISIVMEESSAGLDEVVITAFGKQKKESVVSAITTIKPSELKIPSSNLTQAFAGRIAGVIAYQRSGEPGLDNADFFIRGVTTFSQGGSLINDQASRVWIMRISLFVV